MAAQDRLSLVRLAWRTRAASHPAVQVEAAISVLERQSGPNASPLAPCPDVRTLRLVSTA